MKRPTEAEIAEATEELEAERQSGYVSLADRLIALLGIVLIIAMFIAWFWLLMNS